MFELPPVVVLVLASILAIALYVFFWRVVKDLSLPMKIVARIVLTVLLILPLALVLLSSNFSLS